MDIEQRLDRIESRAAILELAARYCHGADRQDAKAFRSVWHSDAVWDDSTRRFGGIEQIMEAVARQGETFESMHHSTSNSSVDSISEDEATGHHDVLTLTILTNGRALLSTGHYADRYTRSDSRWAISERLASVVTTVELYAPAR